MAQHQSKPINRRSLLKHAIGAAAVAPWFSASRCPAAAAAGFPVPIDTRPLAKFIDALPIPAVIRPGSRTPASITLTQFQTRMHSSLPMTTVWGYNGNSPGVTIEAQSGTPAKVRFVNNLPTKHLLPVDPTIDGAFNYAINSPNPAVRTVTHLHGGHTRPEHDGFPEHWYVPGVSRDHVYDNNQPAATLWYHDHTMGITRLNVYAGLAGFYLIRDKAEAALNLPRGTFEIPLLIQDRCFNADGSLFFPTTREYFDGFAGPYSTDPVNASDVPPV